MIFKFLNFLWLIDCVRDIGQNILRNGLVTCFFVLFCSDKNSCSNFLLKDKRQRVFMQKLGSNVICLVWILQNSALQVSGNFRLF